MVKTILDFLFLGFGLLYLVVQVKAVENVFENNEPTAVKVILISGITWSIWALFKI